MTTTTSTSAAVATTLAAAAKLCPEPGYINGDDYGEWFIPASPALLRALAQLALAEGSQKLAARLENFCHPLCMEPLDEVLTPGTMPQQWCGAPVENSGDPCGEHISERAAVLGRCTWVSSDDGWAGAAGGGSAVTRPYRLMTGARRMPPAAGRSSATRRSATGSTAPSPSTRSVSGRGPVAGGGRKLCAGGPRLFTTPGPRALRRVGGVPVAASGCVPPEGTQLGRMSAPPTFLSARLTSASAAAEVPASGGVGIAGGGCGAPGEASAALDVGSGSAMWLRSTARGAAEAVGIPVVEPTSPAPAAPRTTKAKAKGPGRAQAAFQ